MSEIRCKREVRTKVGAVFKNNSCENCEVIEVFSATKILVRFENGFEDYFSQDSLERCSFKNKTYPSVYGVGFSGKGVYSSRRHNKIYKKWQSMLQRCFDREFQKQHDTYLDCTVCEDWFNFQNFAEWAYSQPNYSDNYKLHLDKDLLKKGNRLYSPENCCFIPHEINTLIVTTSKVGTELPVGVIWHKRDNEYRAQMTIRKGTKRTNVHILSSKCPHECFLAYKSVKEQRIKDMAEEFKDFITKAAYDALMSREVEITD